jgi:hypothetical protein
MKNSNDTIGNRTRDLPVCNAVSQPLRHRVPRLHTGPHGIFGGQNYFDLGFLPVLGLFLSSSFYIQPTVIFTYRCPYIVIAVDNAMQEGSLSSPFVSPFDVTMR